MSLGQPSAPSPTDIANATNQEVASQTATNTGIGESNQAGSNYDESDPYGSLTYAQTGTGANGTPIYSSTVSLSPEQQALLNQLQGTQTSAGSQAGNLISNANYGSESPTDAIGSATSGIVGQEMSEYLAGQQPFFTTQTSQLDTQLRNQGLAPGDPAYDNAMRANTSNQALAVNTAESSFEPTAYTQATNTYELPAELGESLASFGSPTNPTTELEGGAALNTQTPNSSADLSAETTAAQNQYAAQQAQYNAMVSGLMNVGTGALALA